MWCAFLLACLLPLWMDWTFFIPGGGNPHRSRRINTYPVDTSPTTGLESSSDLWEATDCTIKRQGRGWIFLFP
jgi:hypothetical protein